MTAIVDTAVTVEKCTPHTIRSGVLDTIVIAELNRAIRYARSNKEQFVEAAMQKGTTQARRELAALQSEYNTLMNRKNVLSTLIDKIIIGERENRHAKKNVKQKIRILFKGFGELDDLMSV